MKATMIRKLDGFTGDAALYELSEPVGYDMDWDTDEYKEQTTYVIVSATIAPFTGAETYVFPADKDGEILGWSELAGSYRGGLDHQQALDGLVAA